MGSSCCRFVFMSPFCLFLTIIKFNSTSRYLDGLLNIDNPYFKQMASQIYPTELKLNKANFFDTESNKVAKIRNRYNQVPHLTQKPPF